MSKQYTAHEIEKKVLDYINKKTNMGYATDFNPLDVSKEIIAEELNLNTGEVEEAIDSLSGKDSGKGSKVKRIESIKPRFEIWLPFTKKGQEIKDELCESGLAVRGNLNVLYSFLLLVLSYFFIFEKPYLKNFLGLVNPEQYFAWAAILTAVSIPLGNYLSRKWYQGNLLMQRVKGSKYYVYALIAFIILIIISINKKWNIGIILSGMAVLTNIALVIYQIIKDNKKKSRKSP